MLVLCAPRPRTRSFPHVARLQQALHQRWRLRPECRMRGFRLWARGGARHRLRRGEHVLLIGAETMSRIVDWEDRSTAILFGDGAGAVVLDARRRPGRPDRVGPRLRGALGTSSMPTTAARSRWTGQRSSVGRSGSSSSRPSGPSSRPGSPPTSSRSSCRTRRTAASSRRRPHGSRSTTTARCRHPRPTGNTSAASIPMALAEAARPRATRPRRRDLLIGFGAGMSWASAVLEWENPMATTGRHRLVTGGSKGIGLACAQDFAEAGHRVAGTFVRRRTMSPGCSRSPATSRPEQVEAAVGRVEDELGPVEVLVSNAGITRDGLLVRMSEEDFADVIATNLTATWRMAKRVLPKMMRARWGRIVFVSSVGGHRCPAARRTTPPRRQGSSALPARSPASTARGASRPTSWRPVRSTPTCSPRMPDDRRGDLGGRARRPDR